MLHNLWPSNSASGKLQKKKKSQSVGKMLFRVILQ